MNSEAFVFIPTPARYMGRLCNHFAHRVKVHREADRARIDFPNAVCTLFATNDRLLLRIEAPDAAELARVQEVVARHLQQVASAETVDVTWRATAGPGERR